LWHKAGQRGGCYNGCLMADTITTDGRWWIAALAIDSGLLDGIVPVNLHVLEQHRELSPEQFLYAALLQSAMEDLDRGGELCADAVRWFRGGRAIVPLRLVCEALDLDYRRIQRLALRRAEAVQNMPVLPSRTPQERFERLEGVEIPIALEFDARAEVSKTCGGEPRSVRPCTDQSMIAVSGCACA
jgi:hypothetical protein